MKSLRLLMLVVCAVSLPVRGAWIEIQTQMKVVLYKCVAPRAGSVD